MFRIFFADIIRILQPPSPLELAEEELAIARRELLKAYSAEEYAQNIAIYNEQRIKRLIDFINQQENSCQSSPSSFGTSVPAPIQLSRTSTSNSGATSKKSWR